MSLANVCIEELTQKTKRKERKWEGNLQPVCTDIGDRVSGVVEQVAPKGPAPREQKGVKRTWYITCTVPPGPQPHQPLKDKVALPLPLKKRVKL
eukprot:3359932-Rhodomonas_salina.1